MAEQSVVRNLKLKQTANVESRISGRGRMQGQQWWMDTLDAAREPLVVY
jgi:hypothetical protein